MYIEDDGHFGLTSPTFLPNLHRILNPMGEEGGGWDFQFCKTKKLQFSDILILSNQILEFLKF